MKGVIFQINPRANIIDLCHQIEPQDIQSASFQLASAYSYFPEGTIHVVVVDPGVGSQREAIAINLGDHILVGPNNGVFNQVLAKNSVRSAVSLDNDKYWLQANVSSTFHGRDIFAPVAAHLSLGVPLSELGTTLDVDALQTCPGEISSHPTQGNIQAIDRFGNLITTIPAPSASASWQVVYRDQRMPIQQTYSDVSVGSAIALIGSHGWIEIAVNQGNAQIHFQAAVNDSVSLILFP